MPPTALRLVAPFLATGKITGRQERGSNGQVSEMGKMGGTGIKTGETRSADRAAKKGPDFVTKFQDDMGRIEKK